MPQLLIPQGAYYITGYYTAYNMNICNNDDEPVCHLIKKKKKNETHCSGPGATLQYVNKYATKTI